MPVLLNAKSSRNLIYERSQAFQGHHRQPRRQINKHCYRYKMNYGSLNQFHCSKTHLFQFSHNAGHKVSQTTDGHLTKGTKSRRNFLQKRPRNIVRLVCRTGHFLHFCGLRARVFRKKKGANIHCKQTQNERKTKKLFVQKSSKSKKFFCWQSNVFWNKIPKIS